MKRVSAPFAIGSFWALWNRKYKNEAADAADASVIPENNGILKENAEIRTKPAFFGSGEGVVDAELRRFAEGLFRLLLKRGVVQKCAPSARQLPAPGSSSDLVRRLKSLTVDKQWRSRTRWPATVVCGDEDLACEEGIAHPGQHTHEDRLNQLLKLLVLKVQDGYGRSLISQGILDLLYDVYSQYRGSDRGIVVNSLKILANIALQDDFCAAALANSEWPPVIALMLTSDSLEENLLSEKICLNALSTFEPDIPKLQTDVYQLFCSEEEPTLDIVFMHGLRGGVFRTWREKDDITKTEATRCWPRDWLSKDAHTAVRILAIDYTSSFWRSAGSLETLASRSQHFLSQLRAAHVGRRPVVFVCHSFGGLLVKRILIDDEQLRGRTVGVLFMATPHRGSPFAEYARFALRPTEDITLLRRHSEINRQLHDDFLKISSAIPVFSSVIEMRQVPIVLWQKGIVVPSDSAIFERGPLYHVDDIHHNVCKPNDRDDVIYKVVMQFLFDVLDNLRKF